MKLAVDSSAFAKRYIQEAGSGKLDRILAKASELAVCVILVPEIVSALSRRLRERVITLQDYRAIKKQFLEDVRDATILQITPSAVSRSVKLLEGHALRALDALHVACALEWQADLFLTADKKQLAAARNSGLKTEYLGRPEESTGN